MSHLRGMIVMFLISLTMPFVHDSNSAGRPSSFPTGVSAGMKVGSSSIGSDSGDVSALRDAAAAKMPKASGRGEVAGSAEPTDTDSAGVADPAEIIRRVDENMYSDFKKMKSRMLIRNKRGDIRELTMHSFMAGDEKSYSEYISPAKEKGTKMLKVGKNLWTYTPRADRIIHIAGHLLRQSVMGSDLSYEDSMEETRLLDVYSVKLTGKKTVDGRPGWEILLIAREEGQAYPIRKVVIDRERYIPLLEERLGSSGRLLKTLTVSEARQFGTRWFPVRMTYRDVLKDGGGTEFIVDEIEFDPDIPESVFTKASLKR